MHFQPAAVDYESFISPTGILTVLGLVFLIFLMWKVYQCGRTQQPAVQDQAQAPRQPAPLPAPSQP